MTDSDDPTKCDCCDCDACDDSNADLDWACSVVHTLIEGLLVDTDSWIILEAVVEELGGLAATCPITADELAARVRDAVEAARRDNEPTPQLTGPGPTGVN